MAVNSERPGEPQLPTEAAVQVAWRRMMVSREPEERTALRGVYEALQRACYVRTPRAEVSRG